MNILYEIGLEGKGTLMMIPANTLTAGISTFGISEFAKAQADKFTQISDDKDKK